MITFLNKEQSNDVSPWQTMIDSALQAFPEECCGFICGHSQYNNREVISVFKTGNAAKQNKLHHFEISPADYLAAEYFAAENELTLLGLYHSHPNHPATPSVSDYLSAFPNFSYIIISVSNQHIDAVRCWQINDFEQFEEQEIKFYSNRERHGCHFNSNSVKKVYR